MTPPPRDGLGRPAATTWPGRDGLGATPILDLAHPRVLALAADARAAAAGPGRHLLVAAHRLVAARVRPVYALEEGQPASRTLRRGRGSCSQRLAVLEAAARACGIPTRVRGLLVAGRFWHARLPLLRPGRRRGRGL
ncbi:transglutaminase-like domain-containing protein [Actinomadura sp. ATCC 31491]|uniref:Transglutaminase-like domain-containing protein n=1 Tax=Actinomadura luzonensis TaxID=2805427 RepID=A0ABT0G429_9ACTN|nr:transglutaminase-like domain-containing protein [Actinomadura luzonensis]MCK2219354.1 transglutaminase-like domain-containing protein [Actinomadura luzonensis]